MKLWHFYHVYAQENQEDIWLQIVNEHVDALCSSGLAANLTKTYIGVVGTKNSAKRVSAEFRSRGVRHEVCALYDHGWEQVTQNKLYEFSLKNSGYVLYAHTKGASSPSKIRDLHRKTMTECLIGDWVTNTNLLSDGFCASGVFFLRGSPEEPFVDDGKNTEIAEDNPSVKRYRGFFAGNFWWGNLAIIRKIGYPSTENRIKAEAWMNNLYDSVDSSKYMVHDALPGGLGNVLNADNH